MTDSERSVKPLRVRFLCAAAAVFVLLCGSFAARAHEGDGNVDALFAQAKAMLEDRTMRELQSVPGMLRRCVDAGYMPACKLLLDVYDGKYAGLPAEPELAFALAGHMVAAKAPDGKETAAARQEHSAARAEALYRLAVYYERGVGCRPDARQAYVYMGRAKDAGLQKARAEYARYLLKGLGCEADPKQAAGLLLELAGSAPETSNVFFYLGYICYQGLGLSRPRYDLALYFYRRGKKMLDSRAINELGIMYERGVEVDRSYAEAMACYRLSESLGCREASANVQRLAFKIKGSSASWGQRVRRAAIRVVRSLPLSDSVTARIDGLLRRGASDGL